jgi:hypothetical protein
VQPAQDSGGGSGEGETPGATPSTIVPPLGGDPEASTSVPGGRPGEGPNGAPTTTVFAVGVDRNGGSSSGGPVVLAVLGVLLLVGAWMVFTPRVVRALARRGHRTPRDRVIGAWQRRP